MLCGLVAVLLLPVACALFLRASVYLKPVGMTSEKGHATVVNAVNMQSFIQTIEVLMTPFIMGIS